MSDSGPEHRQSNRSIYAEEDDEVLVTSVLSTLLLVMFLVGIAGNAYTLAVAALSARMGGSLGIYVVNLAAADLLYLCTIPFVVSTYLAQDWFFSDAGCRLLLSLDLLTMHASIYTLTVMSLERHRAVVRPLSTRLSRGNHRLSILLIWLASLLLTLPMMVMVRVRETEGLPRKRICSPTWTPQAFKVYLTVLFATSILAPGLIIAILYASLARAYWISGVNVVPGERWALRHKVLYRLFTIIVAFWACFVPFWAWQLAKLYAPRPLGLSIAVQAYINFSVTCLTYANSCINPLLYTLLTRNYRDYLASRGGSSTTATSGEPNAASGIASQWELEFTGVAGLPDLVIID
ncbi:urotensin-2 receptor-like [Ambystoma mexicanum]|uniref:urotensin-2 receptor-like n=1 Tax=Ambystoma mexicanum TaxID=8296 RepID=UPI0037E7789B